MQSCRLDRIAPFGVIFASICFGLVPWFSKGLTDAGLAPHAVAFARYAFAALVLGPLLIRERTAWQAILWAMGAGAMMGLGWIGYVSALQSLPAATVGVLYMTYPAFTLAVAWIVFRDSPRPRAVIAAALILTAAAIAGGAVELARGGLQTVLIALTAPLGFAIGITVLVHRLGPLSALARVAGVSLGSLIGLAPLMAGSTMVEITPPTPLAWAYLAGIGLLSALIPQLIYVICSPRIGTARTAVLGSVELPTMIAVGYFALGQAVGLREALACLLIVGAMVLAQQGAATPRSMAADRS